MPPRSVRPSLTSPCSAIAPRSKFFKLSAFVRWFTVVRFRYAALFTYISCLTDDNVDYKQVFYKQLEESWKAAGVKDVNEPYEWEAIMKPVDAEPNQ